jgi:hypothetical protein
MKDPLTKSKSFVSMLREHCSKVHIRELDAGESLSLSCAQVLIHERLQGLGVTDVSFFLLILKCVRSCST